MKKTILYVGGFILPDRNAAAQRVVTIAKALRELGYEVIFFNISPYAKNIEWKEVCYYGFKCYEKQEKQDGRKDFSIEHIKSYVSENNAVKVVIAYNYPTIGLIRLSRFCRRHNISCIGDITEWYRSRDEHWFIRMIKNVAISYRMKVLQKQLIGNIVISDYLENYYKKSTKVVNIPPLVDKKEDKWRCQIEEHEDIRFIYAGAPNKMKERLDQIVDVIIELRKHYMITLEIVGITLEEFIKIYDYDVEKINNTDCITFLGRIPHVEVIKHVANSDYSLLIRDKNKVTKAGFPTKFVESISCGTTVVSNDNSCVSKYLLEGKNGMIVSQKDLMNDVKDILDKGVKPYVCTDLFDYRNYLDALERFMKCCIP